MKRGSISVWVKSGDKYSYLLSSDPRIWETERWVDAYVARIPTCGSRWVPMGLENQKSIVICKQRHTFSWVDVRKRRQAMQTEFLLGNPLKVVRMLDQNRDWRARAKQGNMLCLSIVVWWNWQNFNQWQALVFVVLNLQGFLSESCEIYHWHLKSACLV